jgi:hypothetical protein
MEISDLSQTYRGGVGGGGLTGDLKSVDNLKTAEI